MQIQEKPDVTYKDVGGCTQQIEQMREVVELPMLHVRILSVVRSDWPHSAGSPSPFASAM
jgi:ATP-dependent 26S proteasome regulatory subunit